MEHCVNHSNRAAVEHCEVCGRALCGHCLWYTEDGHRLCEIHAQEREAAGETVLPPETYAAAINTQLLARQTDEKPRQRQSENGKEDIPYKGNSQDLTALLAAVMAVTVLLSCMGGAYCLPVAAFILGIVGFANASKAVDPKRTKLLSSISLGVGGLIFLGFVAYIGFFVMFFLFTALAASGAP